MKSYRINKKEAEQKLKSKKGENAQDIISKSFKNHSKASPTVLAGFGRFNYKSFKFFNYE